MDRLESHRSTVGLPVGDILQADAARHGYFADLRSSRITGHPADHEFWHEGDTPPFVGVIRSGLVRIVRHSAEGRRNVLMVARPGDIVGFCEMCRGYGASAVTAGSLLRIDRGEFEGMLERSAPLRAALRRQHVRWLDHARRMIWIIGCLRPDERLRAFLLMATTMMSCSTLPDGTRLLTIEYPRRDLADKLATTPETICRLLHRFDVEGLIKLEDPKHVRLIDMDGLARGLSGLPGLPDRGAEAADPPQSRWIVAEAEAAFSDFAAQS